MANPTYVVCRRNLNTLFRDQKFGDKYRHELARDFNPHTAAHVIRESFGDPACAGILLSRLDTLSTMQFEAQHVLGELWGRVARGGDSLLIDPVSSSGDALAYQAFCEFRDTTSPNAARVLLKEVNDYQSLTECGCPRGGRIQNQTASGRTL